MSKKSMMLIAAVVALGALSVVRTSVKHNAYAAEDPQIAHAEKMIPRRTKNFSVRHFRR